MEALIEKDPDLKHLSRGKLYVMARQRAGLGKKEVDAYLEKERDVSRELFAKPKRTRKRDQFTVTAPPFTWQMDIIHMDKDKGVGSFLLLVEVLSRKAWAHVLKNGTMQHVKTVYADFIREVTAEDEFALPISIMADGFFEKKGFPSHSLKKHKVPVHTFYSAEEHISAGGAKLGVLDRCARTLRGMLARMNNSSRWTQLLPRVVALYNRSPHRMLPGKVSPAEMYDDHFGMFDLWEKGRKRNAKVRERVGGKFEVGDYVRVLEIQGTFEKKSVRRNMSKEVYKVTGFNGQRYEVDGVRRKLKIDELVKVPGPAPAAATTTTEEVRAQAKANRKMRKEGIESTTKKRVVTRSTSQRAKRASTRSS